MESGLGHEALEQVRPVPHLPEPVLHQSSQLADIVLGEIGQGPLEV
jgi:hypothetical protein